MMFIKRFLLVAFILLSFNNRVFTQNLIPNPSFEKCKKKSNTYRLSVLEDWYNTTLATPDSQTATIHWSDVTLKPKYGDSFVGMLWTTNTGHAEYISVKLNSQLIKGTTYCIKMHVACRKKNNLYAPYGIDVLFTSRRINLLTRANLTGRYSPSIRNIGNRYITNSSFWRVICSHYKAQGNKKYLTIGNFTNNFVELSGVSNLGRAYQSSYILIDNVSLIPIRDSSQCDCSIKRYSIETIQNDSISKEERNKLVSKEGSILSLKNLQFNTNSYEIKPESYKELNQLYSLLSSNPELRISVNGYTDNNGSERYNQKLSMKRAKAVVEYLIEKGISEDRLSYKGYGIDNPIASNETEEGRAANRRVEVEFLKEKIENEKTNH